MSSIGGSGWEEAHPCNRVDTLFEGVIVSLANALVMGMGGHTLGGGVAG